MAFISKIKLPNGTTYDIKDKNSVPFVVGTQTAVTGAFVGTSSDISALYNGLTIRYWLPYNGSGNATLDLTLADGTKTGAKPIYITGTSRLTTHYGAGNVITMTYVIDGLIGTTKYTGWWCDADRDTNDYYRLRYQNVINAGTTAIVANNIIVGINGVYTHLKLGKAFDVTYPILYAASAIAANATGNNNYVYFPFNVTTTQSGTYAAYKPLYIKGKLSGTTFTPVSTTPLTQTVPTTNDGYEYILLGTMYTTTNLYLTTEHPIYKYNNGSFSPYVKMEKASSTSDGLMSKEDKVKFDMLTSSVPDSSGLLYAANESEIKYVDGCTWIDCESDIYTYSSLVYASTEPGSPLKGTTWIGE